MQDRTGLTVFLVRVVFVLFETRRFCKVARFVFPDLEGIRKVPSFFFFQGGKYHSLVGKYYISDG